MSRKETRIYFMNISLSGNTIAQRIEEMTNNVKQQLHENNKRFLNFSIDVDESTDTTPILIIPLNYLFL